MKLLKFKQLFLSTCIVFFLAPCVLGEPPEALTLFMGQNRSGGYYSNYNRAPSIGFQYSRPNIYGGASFFSYRNSGHNHTYYTRPNIYGGTNFYIVPNSYSYGTPDGVFSIPRGGNSIYYRGNSIYYNGGRYDSRNGNR